MNCQEDIFDNWDICEEDLANLTESTIFSVGEWQYSHADGEVNKATVDSFHPTIEHPPADKSYNDDPIAFIDSMISELANSINCPNLDQLDIQTPLSIPYSNRTADASSYTYPVPSSTFRTGWIENFGDEAFLKDPTTISCDEVKTVSGDAEGCLARLNKADKTKENARASSDPHPHPQTDLNDLDLKVIATLFHLPISEAAKHLGVGATVLKKRCRRLGIPRWPYRKLKSLDNVSSNLEKYCHKAVDSKERFQELQTILRSQKEAMIQKPSIGFDPELRRLRQELFKHGYKFKQAQQRACLNVQ